MLLSSNWVQLEKCVSFENRMGTFEWYHWTLEPTVVLQSILKRVLGSTDFGFEIDKLGKLFKLSFS